MYSLTLSNFEKSFNHVIEMAKKEPIEVNADDGTVFIFQLKNDIGFKNSPLDIQGVTLDTPLALEDVLATIRESRSHY